MKESYVVIEKLGKIFQIVEYVLSTA